MKRRWKNKRKAEGKSTENPNIVMNSAVQVCWEKVICSHSFSRVLWGPGGGRAFCGLANVTIGHQIPRNR